jgi:hypothetical protein
MVPKPMQIFPVYLLCLAMIIRVIVSLLTQNIWLPRKMDGIFYACERVKRERNAMVAIYSKNSLTDFNEISQLLLDINWLKIS